MHIKVSWNQWAITECFYFYIVSLPVYQPALGVGIKNTMTLHCYTRVVARRPPTWRNLMYQVPVVQNHRTHAIRMQHPEIMPLPGVAILIHVPGFMPRGAHSLLLPCRMIKPESKQAG